MIDPIFWKGRKVFVTGHTGFKGSWLSLWFKHLNAEVTGYALEPPTEPGIYQIADISKTLKQDIHGDIRNLETFTDAMQEAEPEIVIHMAAQSLVRESYVDPVNTYSTNVMGTVNMLEAVRKTPSVKAVLNITTDKCYENNEVVWGYRENEPMGGSDPYSNSKGCAELVSSAYRKSFLQESGVALATARAGNVFGGGDWAKDRLVPDAIRAFMEKKPLVLRNPEATRPWQHVLESLSGYLMLCQKLIHNPEEFSEGWNFGPNDDDTYPVSTFADILVNNWGDDALWQLDERAHPHEAQYLKLDCSKARAMLNWNPIWGLDRALDETIQWYKAYLDDKEMHEFSLCQIEKYGKERLSV